MLPLDELNSRKLQNRTDFIIQTVNPFLHGLESMIKNIENIIVRLNVNHITFRIYLCLPTLREILGKYCIYLNLNYKL